MEQNRRNLTRVADLVFIANLGRLVEVLLELEDLLRQRVALLLKLGLGIRALVRKKRKGLRRLLPIR